MAQLPVNQLGDQEGTPDTVQYIIFNKLHKILDTILEKKILLHFSYVQSDVKILSMFEADKKTP